MDSLLNQMRDFCLVMARRRIPGMVDVVGGHVMHASSVLLTLRIAQRTVQRGVRAAGRAARDGRMSLFQPACPG